LIRFISRDFTVAKGQLRRDLQRFITVLDEQQLVSIHQSYAAEVVVRVRRRLSDLLRLPRGDAPEGRQSPRRRYPATASSILVASLKAHEPMVGICLIVLFAIEPLIFLPTLRQGSLPSLRMALIAAEPLLAYAALLAASITLHELIHYWAATELGVPLKSVYVAPGRIGITQVNIGSPRNALVSAAGPAGTVVVLVALALLVPLFHLGNPFGGIGGPILCGAVAIVHLLGLTPLTTDGKQLSTLLGFTTAPPEQAS
jgi:hypothetical protein